VILDTILAQFLMEFGGGGLAPADRVKPDVHGFTRGILCHQKVPSKCAIPAQIALMPIIRHSLALVHLAQKPVC
jgi:hypothetical protein